MTDVTNVANQILAKTQEMVRLAEMGELEAFRASQIERDRLIALLESEPLEVNAPLEVREILVEAQQLNNALRDALEAQERKLLNQKSELKRGQTMRRAYGNNQ